MAHISSDTQLFELGLMNVQTGFDGAQALSISQLRESSAEKLIEMRKRLGRLFRRVTQHTATKCVERKKLHELWQERLNFN
jgi:hypothetical protein